MLSLDDKKVVKTGSSSKGNQLKFYDNGYWIKLDNQNDRNRDSECNCNVDLKRFKFFTVGDGDKLLNCLRTNNKYIYLIDRGEIFLTPEMIKLINNYRSTFIFFSRNIPGIKYRVSSYCELYSFEKNEVYYFTNKKINKNNNKSIKNPTVDDVLKMWKMA